MRRDDIEGHVHCKDVLIFNDQMSWGSCESERIEILNEAAFGHALMQLCVVGQFPTRLLHRVPSPL
jgi:hypothetical protein